MSVETRTCIILTCSKCGSQGGLDTGPQHFASIEEAEAEGWHGLFGQAHLCPTCAEEDHCAGTGHRWPRRWTVGADGGRFRECSNCGAEETVQPEQIALGAQLAAEHMQHLPVGAIVTIPEVPVPYCNDDTKVWYVLPARVVEKTDRGWLTSGADHLVETYLFLDAPMTIAWLPGNDLVPDGVDPSLTGPDFDLVPAGTIARTGFFGWVLREQHAMLKLADGTWAVAGQPKPQQPAERGLWAELVALPNLH